MNRAARRKQAADLRRVAREYRKAAAELARRMAAVRFQWWGDVPITVANGGGQCR
jgi:hypothetical protein